MDLSKLKLGQKIVLGAGILLIINLFIPWFRVSVLGFSVNANAFDDFWAWFGSILAIAAAVIIALKVFTSVKANAGPLKAEHLALILGGLGFLFILISLLVNTEWLFIGVFIGLIAAGALTYGAFLAMKEEGLSVQDFKALGGSKS